MKSRILMTGILFGLIHSESTLSAMTYGAGLSMSCGEYVAAVKAGEFEPFTILGNSWILGYVSGYSAATEITQASAQPLAKLKASDPSALTLWVQNYCTQNPLAQLHQATIKLIRALAGL